jgi:DNA-binding MarR family transcriptional regulator
MTAITTSHLPSELTSGGLTSTRLDGLFSSASIQAINVFHKYCGNVDILTLYVWWFIAASKGEEGVKCVTLKDDYKVTAVRLSRSIKVLTYLDLIELYVDKQDARCKLVRLTHKGKALKHDIINSFI